jgi:thiamine pyrophosphate-dependent acetolactate synthase large subunit-like protein
LLSSTAPASPLFTWGHPVFCCAPRGARGAPGRARRVLPPGTTAVHGDGGFLMNSQEIETAVRHHIGVVTIVMNNNCWGSEKAYQKHFSESGFIGCDIGNPRDDQLARLFGAAGYYVEHPDQVGDAVKAALGADAPAIIEIPIDPDEFPTPAAAVRRPD